MSNKREMLMVLLTVVLVFFLTACGTSHEESTNILNTNSTQNTNDDSQNADSTENNSNTGNTDTDTVETSEKVDTSSNVSAKEEPPVSNEDEAGLKEEYVKKLNDTKKETEKLEATDSSTYALKKVENDRWEIWDRLLNDIYGVLKEQLSQEKMDQLKEEQRNWIKSRDKSALEASKKYEGGTQEHLEYVIVLANLTEARCYELVEDYMK
ncbi:lysozyme inhibitor LprI family protein [Litchfieldia salsa]|uniref:Lysozyme inhibitor LprI-like N-terminal domain-containing protein n=1 Tax=Litchfieldia salsa TaxID=930152 RepID=A0A1H0T299_9BACI|nr:lysozyme inhibitor LprI family protein [Litchfieldia salsa]SDP48207.1 Protein of unknown function [Litchfieldia salsa]